MCAVPQLSALVQTALVARNASRVARARAARGASGAVRTVWDEVGSCELLIKCAGLQPSRSSRRQQTNPTRCFPHLHTARQNVGAKRYASRFRRVPCLSPIAYCTPFIYCYLVTSNFHRPSLLLPVGKSTILEQVPRGLGPSLRFWTKIVDFGQKCSPDVHMSHGQNHRYL